MTSTSMARSVSRAPAGSGFGDTSGPGPEVSAGGSDARRLWYLSRRFMLDRRQLHEPILQPRFYRQSHANEAELFNDFGGPISGAKRFADSRFARTKVSRR
jgi:hypothetical protein